jgi:hypothetical protein
MDPKRTTANCGIVDCGTGRQFYKVPHEILLVKKLCYRCIIVPLKKGFTELRQRVGAQRSVTYD